MLLVKCSCGCFFSISDKVAASDRVRLQCQNCGKKLLIESIMEKGAYDDAFADAGMKAFTIPDGAEVQVRFNA